MRFWPETDIEGGVRSPSLTFTVECVAPGESVGGAVTSGGELPRSASLSGRRKSLTVITIGAIIR